MKWVHIILLQLTITAVVSSVAVILGGKNAGLSSILAGLCCVIPNMLFAYGIHLENRTRAKIGLAFFYVMELVKVAFTIFLVVLVFWQYKNVNWLAFLVSFVIALKSYIFLLFKSKT